MTWLKENWFRVGLIIILICFLIILKTYLRDKNQIEAKIGRAECLHRVFSMKDAPEPNATNVCIDIETYKIKSENW